MIEVVRPEKLRRRRFDPFQLVMRAVVVLAMFGALAATRAAGGETLPTLEAAIIGLALLSALTPDSPAGLLGVLLAGSHWVAAVDVMTTPWVMGFAASMALAHTSMAAATVAPLAARWSQPMRRRWASRLLVQAAVIVPTWAVVRVMSEIEIGANAILMAAALLVVAVVGLWGRSGGLERDPPDHPHGPH